MAAAKKPVESDDAKEGETYVLAPLVQVKFGSRVLHFYQGDVLPDGVDSESLDNLKQLGYVGSADDLEKRNQ